MEPVDVAVIGGGAAGLAAAREARRRGASAVLINDGPPGGDCTFTGCVPSKTLIEAARAGASFTEALDRVRATVAAIAATETADVLRGEGISVIEAEGAVLDRRRVTAGGTRIEVARGVVLALGSRPALPPVAGIDGPRVLTTDTVWDLERRPRSIAIIGGGAAGCELAQALAGLGVKVTMAEAAGRLLPGEEPEAGAVVERALIAAGVAVETGVLVTELVDSPAGVEVRLADGSAVRTERLVVAAGRRPRSDRGGLAEAGIELERGWIVTGRDLATSVRGVYAAGDVTGKSPFTHAADAMGRTAAANVVRTIRRARFDPALVASVTFTRPEVARVGLTEAEAAATVEGAMVAELPLSEHDRAVAAGTTDGYIKLIAGPRPFIGNAGGGRLIGATVVAERAGEIIAELALAMRLNAFVFRLAQTIHPYPTWSYAIPKVAAQFLTTIGGRTARPARGAPG